MHLHYKPRLRSGTSVANWKALSDSKNRGMVGRSQINAYPVGDVMVWKDNSLILGGNWLDKTGYDLPGPMVKVGLTAATGNAVFGQIQNAYIRKLIINGITLYDYTLAVQPYDMQLNGNAFIDPVTNVLKLSDMQTYTNSSVWWKRHFSYPLEMVAETYLSGAGPSGITLCVMSASTYSTVIDTNFGGNAGMPAGEEIAYIIQDPLNSAISGQFIGFEDSRLGTGTQVPSYYINTTVNDGQWREMKIYWNGEPFYYPIFEEDSLIGGISFVYEDPSGDIWQMHVYDTVGTDMFFVEKDVDVEVYIVAGGGGGGGYSASSADEGGGGGGGGVIREEISFFAGESYNVVVGAGGAGGAGGGLNVDAVSGSNGQNSMVGGLIAYGGGGGGRGRRTGATGTAENGKDGGSGGGGGSENGVGGIGVAGQGTNGGNANSTGRGGGGGGALTAGGQQVGGTGFLLENTLYSFSYGGGVRNAGSTHYGSGGGGGWGGSSPDAGQNGVDGIVILRYRVGGIPL